MPDGFRKAAVWLLCMLAAAPVQAQVTRDSLLQDTLAQDTLERGVSPRGAMIRSILIPGWGQGAVGSYTRGGIFFAIRGSSYYMLFRTIARLEQSRDVERRLRRMARDSLDALIATDTAAARRLSDPAEYEAAVSAYPGVSRARRYVNSRRQQRQDWIAYTLFFTVLDAVDAYVNAQLRGFPVSIASDVDRDGGLTINASVPLPPWLGGSRPVSASARAPALRR